MIGTNHFASFRSAAEYYRPQGFSGADIADKINNREIVIGEPKLEKGEKLTVVEGRYHIENVLESLK